MAYTLWTRFLRHAPTDPDWPDRDRFVLSAGHASMLLYSLLHLTGYDLSLDELKRFRQWGSRTPGHPEFGDDARRRGHDRPARPGRRQRRRHGHRRAPPRRASSTGRATRSSTTGPTPSAPTATSRRGSRPRRPAWPGTSSSASWSMLYDDNLIQLDGPDGDWRSPRTSSSASGRTAGRPCGSRTAPTSARSKRRSGCARSDDRPVDHRRAHRHRLRLAQQGRHPEGPRRAPRPGRGPRHQGGLRLGSREVVLRPGRGRRPLPRAILYGEELAAGGPRRSSATAPTSRPRPPRSSAGSTATWRPAGTRTSRAGRGRRGGHPQGQPGHDQRPGGTVPELFGGSADLSEFNLTDVAGGGIFDAAEAGRNLRFGVREHAMGGIANGIACTAASSRTRPRSSSSATTCAARSALAALSGCR